MRRFPFCLLLLVCALLCAGQSVTILHTNDLHAQFSPLRDEGGFPQLAYLLRREKAGCKQCLHLDGGDAVQGHPVSTIFKGVPVFEITSLLGIDVATLGNHEFDYGADMIPEFIRTARYPLICANVVGPSGEPISKPYVIRKVNGIRIGIIGLVLDELVEMSTPARLAGWRPIGTLEATKRYAGELSRQADVVIVLGHITDAQSKRILHELPEVQAVISGHGHTGLVEPLVIDGRPVVRVKAGGTEFGRLALEIDKAAGKLMNWKWNRVPVPASTPQAEDVARAVRRLDERVSAKVDIVIGESAQELDGDGTRRLVQRAMKEESGADLAFVHMGGIRSFFPKGRVLARHIWNILPFDDELVTGRFKGAMLPEVVRRDWQIDPDREYTLVVRDFTAINQQATMQTPGLEFPIKLGRPMRDVVIDWVKRQKQLP